MVQAPPRTILEIFESLPEGTLCELINNRIVMPPSPSFEHQDLSASLSAQLYMFVTTHQLGKVVAAPLDVYLGKENVFQPDILFISAEKLSVVQRGKVRGAPDLVIEILSPGSENYDQHKKRDVYERFGVQEYWIVDPETKQVTGFQLKENAFVEIPSQPGAISSPLLNTTIRF